MEHNIENISQNAGKVLLQIYLIWKQENGVPEFNNLLNITNLGENELKRALKYCHEKDFIDLVVSYGMGTTKMSGQFWIKDITAQGIDIIENPQDEKGIRPFNVTFNLNNNFNIDSIIRGEVKLF